MSKAVQYLLIGIDKPLAMLHFLFHRTAYVVNQFILNSLGHDTPVVQVFDDVVNMIVAEFHGQAISTCSTFPMVRIKLMNSSTRSFASALPGEVSI